MPQPPPRTLDDVRDQVAASTALRAVRKAETVDGTRVGVVLTLSKHEDEKFLIQVAAHVKRVMLLGQYIFAISTSGSPTLPSSMSVHAGAASTMGSERRESMGASTAAGARSPVTAASSLLICGSSAALVHRAVMLACSKFLTRVEEVSSATSTSGGTRWLGLVHSTFASSHSSTYDEAALWDVVRKSAQAAHLIDPYLPPPGARSIAQLLEAARARLARVTPEQAYAELRDAAHPIPVVLVDIRPEAQRLHHGGIHGSLVIERNVLEWRFDPRSDARLSIADRYDLRVIVFCQEGYTSSLRGSLQDLGLLNATDVDGGL